MVSMLERPRRSRLLSEIRKERRRASVDLDPGKKMQVAFWLSMQARKFLVAGLQSQGFTESEIRNTVEARRR